MCALRSSRFSAHSVSLIHALLSVRYIFFSRRDLLSWQSKVETKPRIKAKQNGLTHQQRWYWFRILPCFATSVASISTHSISVESNWRSRAARQVSGSARCRWNTWIVNNCVRSEPIEAVFWFDASVRRLFLPKIFSNWWSVFVTFCAGERARFVCGEKVKWNLRRFSFGELKSVELLNRVWKHWREIPKVSFGDRTSPWNLLSHWN